MIKNRLRCSGWSLAKQHGAADRGKSGSTFGLLISSSEPNQDRTGHSPANTRQYRRAHTRRNSAARRRRSFVTVWCVAISLGPPPAFPKPFSSSSPRCLPCGFVRPSVLRHEELFCKIEKKKKKISKAADCWELTVHFFMQDLCFPFFKSSQTDEFSAF